VVLVNGETSGGAELIVAALQDYKRAAVAGQRTLGKASIQKSFPLDVPGANVKLTEGEFVRPSGKNLHRKPDSGPRDDWGVRPDADLECRVSPQLAREMKEQWQRQTLRPGDDNQALPMDDPKNDPQRQVALDYLLRRLRHGDAAKR
jgi:carboxyl-terminal processing protease